MSFERIQDLRRQFGGLVPARQRAAALRRPRQLPTATQQPDEVQIEIDWTNTEVWKLPGCEGPIRNMAAGLLWQTINWIVRNQLSLFERYATDQAAMLNTVNRTKAANGWLRVQPAFRALVQEALRQDISFPTDVFAYLRDFVLVAPSKMAEYTPWQDPADAEQLDVLRPFLQQPLMPGLEADARELRSIQL